MVLIVLFNTMADRNLSHPPLVYCSSESCRDISLYYRELKAFTGKWTVFICSWNFGQWRKRGLWRSKKNPSQIKI